MSAREVWVTGLGAMTAVGTGVEALREAILKERSGVRPVEELNGMPAGRVAELPRSRLARRLDRSATLFTAAAEEAWRNAELDENGIDPRRCAVTEGSSLGPMAELLVAVSRAHQTGSSVTHPAFLIRFMSGAGSATFAQAHGIEGPVFQVSAGSVSAACAIGEAFRWIASGRVDLAVAGGTECPLHPAVVDNFRAAGILAEEQDSEFPCRPFDVHRTGTVLGEGAGVLVLEAEGHARRRGATPRAVIGSYGLACESYSIIAPDPEGAGVVVAAEQALNGSAVPGVGWIKTHGTATRQNDAAECRGLATVFGPDLPEIPLAGLKPLLGHCLGASASVEAVATILALEEGVIPATLGTKRVDPALPSCTVVTRTREAEADAVLLLSESFGGRCAALVVRRV